MRTSDELPTVLDFLTREELEKAIFTIPAVGKEIEVLFNEDSKKSPKSNILRAVRLTLQSRMVTPIHLHEGQEKLYTMRSDAGFSVGMIRNGELEMHDMFKEQELIVPAGCPHFVKCFPRGERPCYVRVIKSSQDGGDIIWEMLAPELAKGLKVVMP